MTSNASTKMTNSSCIAAAPRARIEARCCCSQQHQAQRTLETFKKIDHEYALRGELDAAWAARPLGVSRYREQLVLVREDPGGQPLSGLIRGPTEIRQFLRMALGLAAALGKLHQRGLIHKDVKPPNILVDSATGRCWLTGFGIASRLPRERQAPAPPEFIA